MSERQVVDLCDSAERKERRKRRREERGTTLYGGSLGAASSAGAIEISDDQEVEVLMAPSLRRRGRREKRTAQVESDAVLARRLQEEEERRAEQRPPPFDMFSRSDLPPNHVLASALRSRAGGDFFSSSGGLSRYGLGEGSGFQGGLDLGGTHAAQRGGVAYGGPTGGAYSPYEALHALGGAAGPYGPLVAGLLGGGYSAQHGAAAAHYAEHAAAAAAAASGGIRRGHGGGGHGTGGGGGFGGGGGARQLAHLSFLDRDFGEQDYEMLLQLDEADGEEKKRHALKTNAKAIDNLPTKKVSRAVGKEEGTCAICLEGMRANQVVLALRCRHEYHRGCITKWLKSCETPTCPQCKAPALAGGDGADDPYGGRSREGSTEQLWWHTLLSLLRRTISRLQGHTHARARAHTHTHTHTMSHTSTVKRGVRY